MLRRPASADWVDNGAASRLNAPDSTAITSVTSRTDPADQREANAMSRIHDQSARQAALRAFRQPPLAEDLILRHPAASLSLRPTQADSSKPVAGQLASELPRSILTAASIVVTAESSGRSVSVMISSNER